MNGRNEVDSGLTAYGDEGAKTDIRALPPSSRLIVIHVLQGASAEYQRLGWSPERVEQIRRTYVDQSRVVVAIGERIAAGSVNRGVNRSESSA